MPPLRPKTLSCTADARSSSSSSSRERRRSAAATLAAADAATEALSHKDMNVDDHVRLHAKSALKQSLQGRVEGSSDQAKKTPDLKKKKKKKKKPQRSCSSSSSARQAGKRRTSILILQESSRFQWAAEQGPRSKLHDQVRRAALAPRRQISHVALRKQMPRDALRKQRHLEFKIFVLIFMQIMFT